MRWAGILLTLALCAARIDAAAIGLWCGTSSICVSSTSASDGRITWRATNTDDDTYFRVGLRFTLSPINGTIPSITLLSPPTSTWLASFAPLTAGTAMWRQRILFAPSRSFVSLELLYDPDLYSLSAIDAAVQIIFNLPAQVQNGSVCQADASGVGTVCAVITPNAWSTRVTVNHSYGVARPTVQVFFSQYGSAYISRYYPLPRPSERANCVSPSNVPYCKANQCCMETVAFGATNTTSLVRYEIVSTDAPISNESFTVSFAWLFGTTGIERYDTSSLITAEMPVATEDLVGVTASINGDNVVSFYPFALNTTLITVVPGYLFHTAPSNRSSSSNALAYMFQVTDKTVITYDPVCYGNPDGWTMQSTGDFLGRACPEGVLTLSLTEFSEPMTQFWEVNPIELPYGSHAALPFTAFNCSYGAWWGANQTLSGLPSSLRYHCQVDPLAPKPTQKPDQPLIDLGKNGALFAGVLVAGTIGIMLGIIGVAWWYRRRIERSDADAEISESISFALTEVTANQHQQQTTLQLQAIHARLAHEREEAALHRSGSNAPSEQASSSASTQPPKSP